MISTQPVISYKYFQFRKNKLPSGIKRLFYLSWEDALWDILYKKRVKKGSTILIPDFYCKDVEKNIKEHGYKVGYYKINKDLTVDKKSFLSNIKLLKPKVIVIFHPIGIESNLLININWLVNVIKDSILIEDSVHRVVDSSKIKIIKKNHFIIDSLRKVVPLQGASLCGNEEDLNFNPPNIFQSFGYRVKVNFYWFLMIICWTFGLERLAERLMLKGYEIIGDSKKPSRGSLSSKIFSNHINVKKIQKEKIKQADLYENMITNTILSNLKIKEKDKKHLRGYPVILPIKNANKILNQLRDNGLMVRFELDGSVWAKKQKIIYLPLGVGIGKKEQLQVCRLVKTAFVNSRN